MFHVQLGSGPQNVVYQNEGQTFVFQGALVPEGTRPVKPNRRPVFRPGTPCELQEPPDLHAAGGPADKTYLTDRTPVHVPPLPVPKGKMKAAIGPQQAADARQSSNPEKNPTFAINLVSDYLKRTGRGLTTPDPMQYPLDDYKKLLKKQGLTVDDQGHIVAAEGGAAKEPTR
jgi:hypothetical protein